MKHKNWSLFMWAVERLKIDCKNGEKVFKKNLRNIVLFGLMNLSGVTPSDVPYVLQEIENELKRRES